MDPATLKIAERQRGRGKPSQTCSRQVGLVHNGSSSTEVGGDTDVLDEGGQVGEGLGVRVGEGVFTGLNSGITQSTGEKGDVGSLVLGDLRDPVMSISR